MRVCYLREGALPISVKFGNTTYLFTTEEAMSLSRRLVRAVKDAEKDMERRDRL